jgi:hypothetical protein
MEDIFGILVILASLIISGIITARKKRRTPEKKEQSPTIRNDESAVSGPGLGFSGYKTIYDSDNILDETVENEESDSPEVPVMESKESAKTGNENKLQEIIEEFDVEEAIIYSEIINRKYF